MEAAAVAILTKAADFLFEQGAQILKNRRERKEKEAEGSAPDPETTTLPPAPSTEGSTAGAPAVVTNRDELLSRQIDQAMLQQKEAEIEHLLALLETHTRNYHLAQEQYAKWGDALVPPIIVNNLEHEEQELAAVMNKLKAQVGDVYHTGIEVPGLDEVAG